MMRVRVRAPKHKEERGAPMVKCFAPNGMDLLPSARIRVDRNGSESLGTDPSQSERIRVSRHRSDPSANASRPPYSRQFKFF